MKNNKGGLMKQLRIENDAMRKKYEEAVREIKWLHKVYDEKLAESEKRRKVTADTCNVLLAQMANQYGKNGACEITVGESVGGEIWINSADGKITIRVVKEYEGDNSGEADSEGETESDGARDIHSAENA